MNDNIKKNTKDLAWATGQLKPMSDLIMLMDKHVEENLVNAVYTELYPKI